mmetsp:Transcript_49813/g.108296  ORF Transcript_49813/g.108296 Transcript_49813/m.108296 type:complete len:82 (+) Transcript_49813:35-280(+)
MAGKRHCSLEIVKSAFRSAAIEERKDGKVGEAIYETMAAEQAMLARMRNTSEALKETFAKKKEVARETAIEKAEAEASADS